eukprot:jgi/Mesen1/10865/ME000093S10378
MLGRSRDYRKKPLKRPANLTAILIIIILVLIVLLCRRKSGPFKEDPGAISLSDIAIKNGINYTQEMLDPSSLSRQLVDQLTLAKAYELLAKEAKNFPLAEELGRGLRAGHLLLSQSATRGRPVGKEEAEPMIRTMAMLIYAAKELHYDSASAIARLQRQVAASEEVAMQASIQSAYFGQLAAEAIPKSLHCVGMVLTGLWARNSSIQVQADRWRQSPKLEDNELFHLCIFSDNVLAAGVVVNSTVSNALNPSLLVFHIVTDNMTMPAMEAWFALSPPRGATVEVRDVGDYTWLNASYVPVLKQLQDSETQSYYFTASVPFRNPKYLSMLNHVRFYIPELFPGLDKIVFLDDDVVVQRDLAPLFHLDLRGNVMGAVETCLDNFHRFHKYLNFSEPIIRDHFDPEACGWAFGMNVFDLAAWKRAGVTQTYHAWQERNKHRTLWKLGTLPPGLLAFYGLMQPIERSWHVLGLGYNANVDMKVIEGAAVIHWNGNMKPWLKLAMSRYRHLWAEYLDYELPWITQCNFF